MTSITDDNNYVLVFSGDVYYFIVITDDGDNVALIVVMFKILPTWAYWVNLAC